MTRKFASLPLLSGVVLACLVLNSSGGVEPPVVAKKKTPPRRAQANQLPQIKTSPQFLAPGISPLLSVKARPEVTDDDRELHSRIAAFLSTRIDFVPNQRIDFFSWLSHDSDGIQVHGWWGFIEKVDFVPGGYMVTLRVGVQARSRVNPIVGVSDQCYEQYAVINGKIRFVNFAAPPHPTHNMIGT